MSQKLPHIAIDIAKVRKYLLPGVIALAYVVGVIIYTASVPHRTSQNEYYRIMNSITILKNDNTTEYGFTNKVIQTSETMVTKPTRTVLQQNTTISHTPRYFTTIVPTNTFPQQEKLILGYTKWFGKMGEWSLDFSHCEHKCKLSTNKSMLPNAAMLLFEQKHLRSKTIPNTLPHQYRVILDFESPGFVFNRFKPTWNNLFNITVTYRRGSTIQHSIYQHRHIFEKREIPLEPQNYSAGKTKDMIAYVSNCHSVGYNRLHLMRELHNHNLTLDLFGKCGKTDKGKNDDSRHRFYLSFENSLCQDYITEKFFKVLLSDQYLIPVVMGGESIEDYLQVAPPDSFIHVENFTSIEQLAEYLKFVASDADSFNRHHKWRETFKSVPGVPLPACELCRIAHDKPSLPASDHLSQWWNEGACRTAKLVHSHISSNQTENSKT